MHLADAWVELGFDSNRCTNRIALCKLNWICSRITSLSEMPGVMYHSAVFVPNRGWALARLALINTLQLFPCSVALTIRTMASTPPFDKDPCAPVRLRPLY